MNTIIEGLASRNFIPVSAEAMAKPPLRALVVSVNGGCDCAGEGKDDCDCSSGPDSGDDDE